MLSVLSVNHWSSHVALWEVSESDPYPPKQLTQKTASQGLQEVPCDFRGGSDRTGSTLL